MQTYSKDKMGQFTAEQRILIMLHYNRTQSLVAVQNAFRLGFPDRNPPSKVTILQNFRKYSEHGTSLNRNKTILADQEPRVPKQIF